MAPCLLRCRVSGLHLLSLLRRAVLHRNPLFSSPHPPLPIWYRSFWFLDLLLLPSFFQVGRLLFSFSLSARCSRSFFFLPPLFFFFEINCRLHLLASVLPYSILYVPSKGTVVCLRPGTSLLPFRAPYCCIGWLVAPTSTKQPPWPISQDDRPPCFRQAVPPPPVYTFLFIHFFDSFRPDPRVGQPSVGLTPP